MSETKIEVDGGGEHLTPSSMGGRRLECRFAFSHLHRLSHSLLSSRDTTPHQHPQARGRDWREIPPHGPPGAAASRHPTFVVVVDSAAAAEAEEPSPAARRGAAEEPDGRR